MSKIRVLLAEDNAQALDYVHEFLSANGCEIVCAVTNGQAAADAAARLLPEVTVLDLSMPVLNGIQAARCILKVNSSAKIVFLTVEKDSDICRAGRLALGVTCLSLVWIRI